VFLVPSTPVYCPWLAGQKGGQFIAKAHHPPLRPLLRAALRLPLMPRLGCRVREHHHGRFGGFAARLDRHGPLAPAWLSVIAPFPCGCRAPARPLGGGGMAIRRRTASAAAAVGAGEIELGRAVIADA
jgi:hypothetical protein